MMAPSTAPPPAFSAVFLPRAAAFLGVGLGNQGVLLPGGNKLRELETEHGRALEVRRFMRVNNAPDDFSSTRNGDDALRSEIGGERAMEGIVGLRGLGVQGFGNADRNGGARGDRDLS